MQEHASRSDISDFEIYAIAKEVEESDKFEALARALEMSEHVKDLNGNARILLYRWKKEMTKLSVPSRPYLMCHLAEIGMHDLHRR